MSLSKKYIYAIIGSIVLLSVVCWYNIYAMKSDSSNIRHRFEKEIAVLDAIPNFNDTLTRREIDRLTKEENLAISETKELLTIHIDKVDNDYTLITIWAAVLSIIFIVFSFFSIYKIEETKNEIDRIKNEFGDSVTSNKNVIDAKLNDLDGKAQLLDKTIDNANEMIELTIEKEKGNFTKQRRKFSKEFNQTLVEFQSLVHELKNERNPEEQPIAPEVGE